MLPFHTLCVETAVRPDPISGLPGASTANRTIKVPEDAARPDKVTFLFRPAAPTGNIRVAAVVPTAIANPPFT
ncbi:hypothetical protein D3C87_1292380 [compost metagenome]